MRGATSRISKARRRPEPWGLAQWLILGLAALFFAASGGCASTQVPTREPAQIKLTENLRSSGCLRGLLPAADELTVGESLAQWVEAEARAECEGGRADRLVDVIDRFNAAQQEASRRAR